VRLEKRAERRQRIFGAAEGRLMRKALWVRDGTDPGVTPKPIWRDAGTQTRSAQAQDAVALVTAGILPADSDVTYERIGLSEADRQRIREDRRRSRLTQTVSALAAAAERAGQKRCKGHDSQDLLNEYMQIVPYISRLTERDFVIYGKCLIKQT
jgi:hypothetical protein